MKRVYTPADLTAILQQMMEYAEASSEGDKEFYLVGLASCGLFHDAIGKVVEIEDSNEKTEITVLEEY